MEKYKYCNMGRARELSSGGREGGRQESREKGKVELQVHGRNGDAHK